MSEMTLQFASAYRSLRAGERAFVDAYVADAEREAARKGERISNALYRPLQADSTGMLDRPMVKAAIVERINQLAADSELTAQRVVKELMNIGFSSLANYVRMEPFGTDGEVLPYFDLSKCTPEEMSAVKKVKIEENMRGGRKIEIELHSKMDALKTLMQYMGLLEADNPVRRAELARPVTAALPASVDDAGAADAYARMING